MNSKDENKKKKKTTSSQNSKKNNNKINMKFIIKIVVFIVLLVLLYFLIKINYNSVERKQEFENSIVNIATLNEKQVFTIDKIYLFSSASATNNEQKRALWDLNLFQYTDIALYLNNHSASGNTDENTIKELSIDNIKFNALEKGTPKLYYKDIREFGKFNLIAANEIKESLDYTVINAKQKETTIIGDQVVSDNTNDITNTVSSPEDTNTEILTNSETTTPPELAATTQIDYANPQIYTTCDNPITLEYVNTNIKENCIISDISKPLIYDGSLLKRGSVPISSIGCNISFNVHITNNLGNKYVATVYIDIPLSNEKDGSSIYDGNISKEISDKPINFFREN